jgi:hypothetical protein
MIARRFQKRAGARRWHARFLTFVPIIRTHAQLCFRHLRGDWKDEAVAEVIANACVAFARLVEQGREDLAYPTVLARYAVAQVREGRKVGSSLNVRDVLSPYAQQRKRFHVERLDYFDDDEGQWREAVVEDPNTPVFDQVCFRIDFPSWLSSLQRRNRRIAQSLSLGKSTKEVAKKYAISAGRISQLRRELHDSWCRFCADLRPLDPDE